MSNACFRFATNSEHGQVEIIDGHNLPKAPGQLSINPYVVLTLDGKAFARSSTSRGATFPVWSSEVFLVRVSPPSPGEWPRTAHNYFKGYRCGGKQKSRKPPLGPRFNCSLSTKSLSGGYCPPVSDIARD